LRFSVSIPYMVLLALSPTAAADQLGIGRPATPAEIAGWDIDVRPDGTGLPPVSGSVAEGKAMFAEKCSGCHTTTGKPAVLPAPSLVGGLSSLASPQPVRTVGSYWPFATTLFDYIRRAMPFTEPETLTDQQVYAVTAYILYLNGIVEANAVMDARSLPRVDMPNRDGFRSVWRAEGGK